MSIIPVLKVVGRAALPLAAEIVFPGSREGVRVALLLIRILKGNPIDLAHDIILKRGIDIGGGDIAEVLLTDILS